MFEKQKEMSESPGETLTRTQKPFISRKKHRFCYLIIHRLGIQYDGNIVFNIPYKALV